MTTIITHYLYGALKCEDTEVLALNYGNRHKHESGSLLLPPTTTDGLEKIMIFKEIKNQIFLFKSDFLIFFVQASNKRERQMVQMLYDM